MAMQHQPLVRVAAALCGAVLLVASTGCSDGDDAAATDRRAKDLREATCGELEDDVRHLTVSQVEALIWDNKLYKTDIPVPKQLLDRAGRPVPFDKMTDKQRTTYIDWKNGDSGKHNLAWSKTARDKLDEVDKTVEDLDVRDRCMGK